MGCTDKGWNITTKKQHAVSYLTDMVVTWSIHFSDVVFMGDSTSIKATPLIYGIFMALECNGVY